MCVYDIGELCKTAEPIEMQFGVDSRWFEEPLLNDGVQISLREEALFKGRGHAWIPDRNKPTRRCCCNAGFSQPDSSASVAIAAGRKYAAMRTVAIITLVACSQC